MGVVRIMKCKPDKPELTEIEMCAHCDERKGGAEGTIWCAECLDWYRKETWK